MNPKVLLFTTAALGFVSLASGQIGAISIAGVSSALAFTGGTLTAYLTPAGAVAVAIGIVGAGIVKKAIAANVAGLATRDFRNHGQQSGGYAAPSSGYGAPSSGYGAPRVRARARRSNPEETANALEQIDAYFYTVANIDYDDCGKRLVCEVEALPAELRNEDEALIAGLFGDSSIDPSSAKAEYDLAAALGSSTQSKEACARRYHKCPMDRKTIVQAMEKQKKAQQ